MRVAQEEAEGIMICAWQTIRIKSCGSFFPSFFYTTAYNVSEHERELGIVHR